MKCPKCNAENPEIAKFCLICGEKLLVDEESVLGEREKAENEIISPIELKKEKRKKTVKKIKKVILGSIVAMALLIIAFFIFVLTYCDHDLSEATCEKAPFCSICEKEVGKPLGHSWNDATCEKPETCIRCDETKGESLGHAWEEATCEKAATCSRCSETDGKALGHKSEKWKTVKKSTCSEKGLKKGLCSRCGEEVEVAIDKKEHKTGEWIIKEKATVDTEGKRIKECSVCKEVVKEESYKITKEEYKNSCGTYSYREIARNPNAFKGKHGKFYGKAIQVMETDIYGLTSYTLRVAINGSYSNVMLVSYLATGNENHILEDDYITMYGEIQGTETYETVMGNNVTIPSIDAKYIDIH